METQQNVLQKKLVSGLLMNEKYQIEIAEFNNRFCAFKDKKIVLYGIGRYTATLLEGIKDYHFVGLMDKNPENIGKVIFNLPVIDKDTAEEIADIIIINTSETYWKVIYTRIKDIKIPVYYKNGELAKEEKSIVCRNPFKELSYLELGTKLENVDVVSFDFFDTLFMRSVCAPEDIFQLLELREEYKGKCIFTQLRNQAKKELTENYSLEELYFEINCISGISNEVLEKAKKEEIQFEERLLIPRLDVISTLKTAMEDDKEVYIISDMYLPKEFYLRVLKKYGVFFHEDNILISGELKMNKSNGTLWKFYTEEVINGKKTLHIGDNIKADIENAMKYGVEAYLTPSAWDLLSISSLQGIRTKICTEYDTAIIGCVLGELFQNPYIFSHSSVMLQISNNYKMGYCVFGPVILTFLLWLMQQKKVNSIEKLVFMSRDGYFLKEDFEYLCELEGKKEECCYIGISRQLAMTAAINTKKDLIEYAKMPYTGDITELMEDRFGIKNVQEKIGKNIEDYIQEYLPEIQTYILNIKKHYRQYLDTFNLNSECAIVDLGFYGNNQRYLNKLIGSKMSGYYFCANLSLQNPNVNKQNMNVCFQKERDHTGEESQILKRMIFLESFLTAPHGMIKAIDKNGSFIYAEKKKNQAYFQSKVEINKGVKQFIFDYISKFGKFKIDINTDFIDWYYGQCFNGVFDFNKEVKKCFYNDNAMMNRIESMLFY